MPFSPLDKPCTKKEGMRTENTQIFAMFWADKGRSFSTLSSANPPDFPTAPLPLTSDCRLASFLLGLLLDEHLLSIGKKSLPFKNITYEEFTAE